MVNNQTIQIKKAIWQIPALAKEESTEEGAMTHCRRVRDEIRAFIESLPESLQK